MAAKIFPLIFIFIYGTYCNDIYLGYPDLYSKLIYCKVHKQDAALWIRSDVFTVSGLRNQVISAVKIVDLRPDKRGIAKVKAGGIGEKFITVELDSPGIFRGFNFLVEVYAFQTGYFLYSHGKWLF